jgi:hypothetical protein
LKRQTLNDNDRSQWIDNDEGLYNWFRSTRMSKKAFVKQYRKEIDEVVNNVRGGVKPAHYLEYGR